MIVVNDSYYPLVMTNITIFFRWPIEIDGLPFLKMGGSFHGELLNNQMVQVIRVYLPEISDISQT